MPAVVSYEIQFVDSAKRQLDALSVPERTRIVAAIEQQLSNEPSVQTRNRKQLRPNAIAPWELRVGKIRVFYDVEQNRNGNNPGDWEKEGNKLYIQGKEIQL